MPVEKCPLCGGQLQPKLTDFQHIYRGVPITLSEIPHLLCTECGEELVDSIFGRIIEESVDQFSEFKKYCYNDLLSCEEAASLLSVSYQVVTTMLSDGKLPGTKIGREWRIPYGVLMDYIQGMSVHNLSETELDIFISRVRLKNSLLPKSEGD